MILGFFVGFICAVVVLVLFCSRRAKRRLKDGTLAIASYDEKGKVWRVQGSYSGIAKKLADIRAGRQPGAIKYVD